VKGSSRPVGTSVRRACSLGGGTIYRLTDPDTGQPPSSPPQSRPVGRREINRFIGVRGDLTNDPSLNL